MEPLWLSGNCAEKGIGCPSTGDRMSRVRGGDPGMKGHGICESMMPGQELGDVQSEQKIGH